MSSDPNSSKSLSNEQEGSSITGNKEEPEKKVKKGQKKNKSSSSSSEKPTEKMEINDNHSSSSPSNFIRSNPSEISSDVPNTHGNNYKVSNRKKNYFNDYEVAEKKTHHSNDYKVYNRKKSNFNEHRNSHSKPKSSSSYNYYYHNYREPCYSNPNYSNRNFHRNRWYPNEAVRDSSDMRFPSFSSYNTHDKNYQFNQSPPRSNKPLPIFNNWADRPNLENEFFSGTIQSENIQPVDFNTSYETHSNNKKNDETIKASIDDQKSPSKKSNKVINKKVKKSPRLPIKAIINTTPAIEDNQNQSGSGKQQKDIVLSENMTGKKLAHWINPSNQKDQAEIRRLVTEFSKSKKKENLIKLKLHTDKVTVNSNGNQSSIEGTNNQNSLPIIPVLSASENSAPPSSEVITNSMSNTSADNLVQTNKRQRSRSFADNASNATFPDEFLPSKRNSSEPLTLGKKIRKPRRRNFQRTFSNPSESLSSRKRKDSVESVNISKKHKCSSAECLEKCIESAILNVNTLIQPERTESIETASLTANTTSKNFTSQKEGVYIKKEIMDELDAVQMPSLSLNELIQKQTDAIVSCQDDASFTPVESLINLFATGNITIKKEFDDPIIDAIRTVDPVLLGKVCEEQPEKKVSDQETVKKVIEPVIPQPPAIPDSSFVPLSNAPLLTLSLKNILNELQIISEEEEKVKDNLLKADHQIQHFQSLLDRWKTKKIKFQSEEEILRNKRNTLVRTMNDLVMQQSLEGKFTTESSSSEKMPPSKPLQSTNVINGATDFIKKEIDIVESKHTEKESSLFLQQDATKDSLGRVDNEGGVIPLESDEVVLLSSPESRIPVIDLDRISPPIKSNDTDVFSKKSLNTDIISANCHKIRDLVAHNAVINSLQIYDDYLYTCASDKTAKRFSLKDPTKVVTYSHDEKNIYHLCIQKIHHKTYVFTTALNSKLITVFNAESAEKMKVYQFRASITNLCRGKFKIYMGLKNGFIATCDLKDQKELLYNEEPIRKIATAHQGGINILVTLSINGNVSIRDADRNGLLIKYVKALTHVPLFMSIHNDWVYLSSAGYLSVLDLSSGTFVKKYELPAAYTSLCVYKDHIFTTSYSGFVRCYSKYDIQDVKAYYGAGKLALTCIHAHDGWVFTGNRTGEISVFKFDSETSLPCQFGNCSMVFARRDDLMYHVLQGKDHNFISMTTCKWKNCNVTIKSWDQEAIYNHIHAHITASFPHIHEPTV